MEFYVLKGSPDFTALLPTDAVYTDIRPSHGAYKTSPVYSISLATHIREYPVFPGVKRE